MRFHFRTIALAASLLACFAVSASAAPPLPGMIHVRGVVKSLKGNTLTVMADGRTVIVQLPSHGGIAAVLPSSRSQIKNGSFLGIASVSGLGGMQLAREVVVFPEAARGTGEGSYPWDLPGGNMSRSKMTNGTVSNSKMISSLVRGSRMTNGTVHAVNGAALTLEYKSGSGIGAQQITLSPGIPIVTIGPGSTALLTPGAHVFVVGQPLPNGVFNARRVMVGKNGLVPPM